MIRYCAVNGCNNECSGRVCMRCFRQMQRDAFTKKWRVEHGVIRPPINQYYCGARGCLCIAHSSGYCSGGLVPCRGNIGFLSIEEVEEAKSFVSTLPYDEQYQALGNYVRSKYGNRLSKEASK